MAVDIELTEGQKQRVEAVANCARTENGRAWAQLAAEAVERSYSEPAYRREHLRDAASLGARAEAADNSAEIVAKSKDRETLNELREIRNTGDRMVTKFKRLGRKPHVVR